MCVCVFVYILHSPDLSVSSSEPGVNGKLSGSVVVISLMHAVCIKMTQRCENL